MRHPKHANPIPTGAFAPIQAIQTNYAGCHFRSRLEARYAVWLDHLRVKWEYEVEGYTFNGNTRYLPDFWLPASECWAEVKPVFPDTLERLKLRLLASNTGHPVICLWGMPTVDDWHLTVYLPTDDSVPHIIDGALRQRSPLASFIARLKHEPSVLLADRKTRHWLPFLPDPDITYEHLVSATLAARRARFEFGESG